MRGLIDGENKVTLTLAIPPDEEADEAVVPIAQQGTRSRFPNPHQTLRYSWEAALPPRGG